jgi:5-methylcytosine-specific restriction endonuclease McrA
MAMGPPRACATPGCARLMEKGASCPDHPRPSARQRGYTAEWARYARAWLRRFPTCGMRRDGLLYPQHSACVRDGLQVQARVVDHIRSIVAGGSIFDPANHQSLCRGCNVRKG